MAKRHLLRVPGGAIRRAACGLRDPRIYTHDPAYVDCGACRRTIYMADAELRNQQEQRKNRRVQ